MVVLALTATGVLMLVDLKPLPPAKARAQRIQGVNHLASVTITLARTNTSFVPPTKK